MGRARNEQQMRATVRIDRPVGELTFNRETGRNEPSDILVVYAGKGRLKSVHAFRQGEVGEGERVQNNLVLTIPWSAPTPVAIHDTVTIVDNPDNPWNRNAVYEVESVEDGDDKTARRINIIAQHR